MDILAKNIILVFSAFAAALMVTCITIHFVIMMSHRLKLYDAPNERKIHTDKISRLGGIGIFLGFVIAVGISPFLIGLWLKAPFSVYGKIFPKMHFIIATILMFLVGLIDDFSEVKARWKLLMQIVAAIIVLVGGGLYETTAVPFINYELELGIFAWPLTFLWIIGVTNAMNLIDGMDGLSATIGTVSFGVYGIVFLMSSHFLLAVISFVLMGTLIGYLMFNYPPARIFMGDSGSLVLGFLLAVLPLVAGSDDGTIMYMPMTLLFIPIVDVFVAIARRIRRKQSFAIPDKEHVHHKLLALGLHERSILMIVVTILVVSAVPVVLMTIVPFERVCFYIMSVWLVIGTGFAVLSLLYRKSKKPANEN